MIKVGCCGYPTSMKKYHESFDLVELNRTFYVYPQMSTVTGWRERSPVNFEFTIKAHQDISHKCRFEIKPSIQAFEQMKRICEALKARILLIQTPGSFRPVNLNDAIEFFHNVEREDLTIVWETRGPNWGKPGTRAILENILKTVDVPHVVDPFISTPAYSSNITYFRLHGTGKNSTTTSIQMTNLKDCTNWLNHLSERAGKYTFSSTTLQCLTTQNAPCITSSQVHFPA